MNLDSSWFVNMKKKPEYFRVPKNLGQPVEHFQDLLAVCDAINTPQNRLQKLRSHLNFLVGANRLEILTV